MTIKALRARIFFIGLALGLAGCSDSGLVSGPSQQARALGPTQPAVGSQVQGYAMDTAFRPVADVTVEVLSGSETGTSLTSDAYGRFTYNGPFVGSVTFRASKEGYVTVTQASRTPATNGTAWVIFNLEAVAPPVNIAGDFTLTFVADGACADIPAEVRTRTYAATITPGLNATAPANTYFSLAVSGAPFLEGYKTAAIGVFGGDLGMSFDWEGPSLVEEVAGNAYLAIQGWAEAAVGTFVPSSIATSFAGSIEYCVTKSAMGRFYSCDLTQVVSRATCASSNHQLILARR